jgi:hypothetical protein
MVQSLPPVQAWVVFWQPRAGSQESSVQKLPSSQEAEMSVCEHVPVAVSHDSVVQAFWSSQSMASWQHPATAAFTHPEAGSQLSVVQTSPSLQEAEMSTFWQPVVGSQESAVQALWSSQDTTV